LLIILLFFGCATPQEDVFNETCTPDKDIRSHEQWLKIKHEQLSKIDNITGVKNANFTLLTVVDNPSSGFFTYCPEKDGLIIFEDKTWVLLISSCSHGGLGISIIRTSENKYYVNTGHACSKIILESKEKIKSLETFLKSSGVRGESWEIYKSEPSASGNGGTPSP